MPPFGQRVSPPCPATLALPDLILATEAGSSLAEGDLEPTGEPLQPPLAPRSQDICRFAMTSQDLPSDERTFAAGTWSRTTEP
jgi:hypothetical protein